MSYPPRYIRNGALAGAGVLVIVAIVVLSVLLAGWTTMLGLGILHGELGIDTAVGFWSAFRVSIALYLLGLGFGSAAVQRQGVN